MNSTSLKELWLQEHKTLREEVISLKECQLDILKWAYSILGGVLAISLGFVFKNESIYSSQLINKEHALPAILALLIGTIIGSFIVQIVVHKTRSIFRMCGYIQLLEKLLSADHPMSGHFPGYENAYHEMRRIQNEKEVGFEITFGRAAKEFLKDLKDKLKISKVSKSKANLSENKQEIVFGKYYRRIAFQIHLLNFLCFGSAIILLILSRQSAWWFLVIWLFGILTFWLWLFSVIRCTALTRMQEVGEHSIHGQFQLWCEAMRRLGYEIDLSKTN